MKTNLEPARREIRALMRRVDPEPSHAAHVAKLALQLFDSLSRALSLGASERLLLEGGACLHDIGWSVAPDGRKHHKESARLIREHSWKHVTPVQRHLIAFIARYHRKALPQPGHKGFAKLSPRRQRIVSVLAALLRIADGLDRRHLGIVKRVSAEMRADALHVRVRAQRPPTVEIETARKKSDLAESVFGRPVIIKA